MRPTLLFDLDGTLIDSAAGILSSLAAALDRSGLAPSAEIDAGLIGPPLRSTLELLTGGCDPATLDGLVERFKQDYDTRGFLLTREYPGTTDLLRSLAAEGTRMFLVTNKRRVPTGLIVEYLGWTSFFSGIYTLDSVDPTAKSKADLVKRVIADASLNPSDTRFVGDTSEDADAAGVNRIEFYRASWGYGHFEPEHLQTMYSLDEIGDIMGLAVCCR